MWSWLAEAMPRCVRRSPRARAARASWCWKALPANSAAETAVTLATCAACTTAPTDILTGAYTEEEYFADLLRVTGGETDQPLARIAIQESLKSTVWMKACGVRFQPSLSGTLHLDRTNAFFLGGGKALLNAYYASAEKRGVRIIYAAEVVGLNISRGVFEGGTVMIDGQPVPFRAKALVAAAGGFESNLRVAEEPGGPPRKIF